MPPHNNERKIPTNYKNKNQLTLSNLYKKIDVLNSNLVQFINKKANKISKNISNPENQGKRVYPCLEGESNFHQIRKNQYTENITGLIPQIERVKNLRNVSIRNLRTRPHRFVNEQNGKLAKFKGLTPKLAIKTKENINGFLSNLLMKNSLSEQINNIDTKLLNANGINCNFNNGSTNSGTSVASENLISIKSKSTPHHTRHTESYTHRLASQPNLNPKPYSRYSGGKKRTSTKSKKKVIKKK